MEGHEPLTATSLSIVPANQVPWDDLKAVFCDRDSGRCNCQRFKTRGWFWEQGLPTVWKGRPDEDKQDDSVWAVTCMVVRKGYRRRGLTYALAAATIPYAKANGARALEAYAMRTQPGKEITWGELHVGAVQVFADAGFREVSSPSVRRVVMRVDF